jgi:hypothetical protein
MARPFISRRARPRPRLLTQEARELLATIAAGALAALFLLIITLNP